MTTAQIVDSGVLPRVAPPVPAVRPARSLLGYLLMPRPKDLIKGLLMPLTFGLATLAAGGVDAWTVLRAAVALVVLELLVYPARYQWNDIRGFAADQRHPAEADRGRLPGPLDRAHSHITASAAVALLRLVLAAALVLMLPSLQLGPIVLWMVLGVFGVAIAYEGLRAAATGRSGAVPAPLSPALVLLWIVVGAGYVVRGLTGLALVIDLPRHPWTGVAAGVTLWAYGVAFVTSRWAIESTAFARLRNDRLVWRCEARHAREHLLALVRWLPERLDARHIGGPADGSVTGWAALRGRTPLSAPWNLAAIVAGTAAVISGRLLTGPATAGDVAVAGVAGAVAATAVVLAGRGRAAVVGAGAVLVALTVWAWAGAPMLAALPWAVVMGAYVRCVAGSLRTLGALGDRVRARLGVALAPVARATLGRETWQVLHGRGSARA
ncbi:hypothetical protein Aab01nite_27130 [Paractinoplanes abujensis]|uniref:Uncharacterized protein n=1 Tax=Paractinoplanes abujensis TaxID=882441 RepID=A0A7W7D3Z5_9ACTN|nr:hypothetical protein [Actinoplanes abujensis]MBB4698391.1 hypothetical protein [Actinoplanes abujensis]GID19123.1 hypothetical protein Aab01nite_27130 [Actinoplanes abujensis]